MKLTVHLFACLACVLVGARTPASSAEYETWVDKQGVSFKAAAIDVLGPFALFQTEKLGGKRVLLSQLTEADCVRFASAIADVKPRAKRWVDATGRAAREIPGNVSVVDELQFFNAEMSKVPEPEFLLLFFAEYGKKRSFEAIKEFIPEYQRVRSRFGDLCEGVLVNVRSRESEFSRMATDLQIPFLIENFRDRNELRFIRRHVPQNGPALTIMTRTGVPVMYSDCKNKDDIERAVLELEALLAFMRPGAIRTWPDRLYYHRHVQLSSFQTGQAAPLLVGHLLDPEALRKAGITTVVATLQVSATGEVTAAVVQPAGGVTSETAALLAATLVKSAVVPAVASGGFVDGSLEVQIEL